MGEEVLARLRTQFYSQTQVLDEEAEIFIRRKEQMFRRVCPGVDDATAVRSICRMLLPNLWNILLTAIPTTLDELTNHWNKDYPWKPEGGAVPPTQVDKTSSNNPTIPAGNPTPETKPETPTTGYE
ncbi:hypothetical protein PR048_001851 [Dryococelus australis]|uniref:Uncharacterized protein n=1 Tax=Dryococelus australis TaxID=614101 RepID=A0ABQ9IIH6_9NEOP|nr:hypothetical protein PR048_001851 [Dryococelus australis]